MRLRSARPRERARGPRTVGPAGEAVILIGIPGSGKSTFYRACFADTHVRINLDMLRTRHREGLLLRACLEAGQPFVVDNTNPRRVDRARYVTPARAAGFSIVGYHFESAIGDAILRNGARTGSARVPVRAITDSSKRLELPSLSEGFDMLHRVYINGDEFTLEEWPEGAGERPGEGPTGVSS